MKSDAAFMIPVFTHTVENWSDYKDEIIDMIDTGDGGDGHQTDFFKYHQRPDKIWADTYKEIMEGIVWKIGMYTSTQ